MRARLLTRLWAVSPMPRTDLAAMDGVLVNEVVRDLQGAARVIGSAFEPLTFVRPASVTAAEHAAVRVVLATLTDTPSVSMRELHTRIDPQALSGAVAALITDDLVYVNARSDVQRRFPIGLSTAEATEILARHPDPEPAANPTPIEVLGVRFDAMESKLDTIADAVVADMSITIADQKRESEDQERILRTLQEVVVILTAYGPMNRTDLLSRRLAAQFRGDRISARALDFVVDIGVLTKASRIYREKLTLTGSLVGVGISKNVVERAAAQRASKRKRTK